MAVVPDLALQHFVECWQVSAEVNRKGWHSVALCLVRQCVEAFSLVELGLSDAAPGRDLLRRWLNGQLTAGALRAGLESSLWPRYGTGLWDEPWADFAGNLARAVQPYAHYSPELQQWQLSLLRLPGKTGMFAMTGPQSYDPVKASRLTLLHALLIWSLARVLLASGGLGPEPSAEVVRAWGASLSRSRFLDGGRSDWATELWPHMWFTDGGPSPRQPHATIESDDPWD